MYKIFLSGQMFDADKIEAHFDAAGDFGYDGIQLRSTHATPDTPEDKLAQIVSEAPPLNGLSCFVGNYGILNDRECADAFDKVCAYIKLAEYLKAPMIRVWPGWQESAAAPAEVWQRAARWMKKSAAYASEYGIKLAMEMHHGTLCDNAESCCRLLEMIKHPDVGVILDPVNLYQVPADYGPAAIGKLAGRIFDVHVKDIIKLESNYFPYAFAYSYYAGHIGRFARVAAPAPGPERFYAHRRINHGGVDWYAVLTGLGKIRYQGALTVESVCENNVLMPSGRELARTCIDDVKQLMNSTGKKQP